MTVPSPHEPPKPFHPYTVTAQRQTQELSNAGHFVDVHEVHFSSHRGNHGMVRVPAAHFTPAHVDNLVQAHLDQIEGVHDLGAAPHPANAA